MTNPTPEQMLELAKICEPDVDWKIESNDLIVGVRKPWDDYTPQGAYEPHKTTERGKAQLMRVQSKLCGVLVQLTIDCGVMNQFRVRGYFIGAKIASASGETLEQAILNLAVEVLL